VNFGNAALVPTGSRTTAYPWLAWPVVASYGFVTPKVGVTAIGYNLATPGTFTDERPSVALPIASVDSGLFFERDTRWFGTEYLQTLEPRAYYLYVPFKDQSAFPVFDTTNADLNYTQLFQENIFAGGDRIANANQISIGATSRLIRPSDGQEQVRAVIGQRYFFTDQKVTIPGLPVRDRQHFAAHHSARRPHHAALDRRARHAVPVRGRERFRQGRRRGALLAGTGGGGEHLVPLHEPGPDRRRGHDRERGCRGAMAARWRRLRRRPLQLRRRRTPDRRGTPRARI
jgi:hypothetical protein